MTLAPAALLGVWFAGRAANPGPIGFRLDDAWIHLVYGRGLLESGFLSYNPGEPSTGCTSPLWAVVLAILHAVFANSESADGIVRAVMLTGAILHVACVPVASAIAARITGGDTFATFAAGALVAWCPPLALASLSGMEIPLTALLLLLCCLAFVRRAWLECGIFLALAALARPEAAVVTLLCSLLALLPPGARPSRWVALFVPSALAATALALHHLWASGAPLPATFYAKSSASLPELFPRLATALHAVFPDVPPFGLGIGWIALVGLVRTRDGSLVSVVPLFVGLAFLLANLVLIEPIDPDAFYHVRYLLPAVPPFLVALAIGASRFTSGSRRVRSWIPSAVLLSVALFQAAIVILPQSRHFHNDVRNINEVQRRIGVWLAEGRGDGWIAASDAGAIRYFSNRPTVDVIGLNTPEMLAHDESWVSTHPVSAIAIMPAWFRAEEPHLLKVVFAAETSDYTVTSNPRMGRQVVVEAAGGETPLRVRFRGFRNFEIDLRSEALPDAGP